MCLWGKPHHLHTFFRLSYTAFLGCLGFATFAFPSRQIGHWEIVSLVVIGASCGMILGYFWVENYYDRRRFRARIETGNANTPSLREPEYEWAGTAVIILSAMLLILVLTSLLMPTVYY